MQRAFQSDCLRPRRVGYATCGTSCLGMAAISIRSVIHPRLPFSHDTMKTFTPWKSSGRRGPRAKFGLHASNLPIVMACPRSAVLRRAPLIVREASNRSKCDVSMWLGARRRSSCDAAVAAGRPAVDWIPTGVVTRGSGIGLDGGIPGWFLNLLEPLNRHIYILATRTKVFRNGRLCSYALFSRWSFAALTSPISASSVRRRTPKACW